MEAVDNACVGCNSLYSLCPRTSNNRIRSYTSGGIDDCFLMSDWMTSSNVAARETNNVTGS
jgi:hypothetical protein